MNSGRTELDYTTLIDLRVDYAFKLFFSNVNRLISLLNAIFAHKGLGRVVIALTIVNPNLEREGEDNKLAILDIRAKLSDGTTVCVEMHLHGIYELVSKVLYSWAKVYGMELKAGESYNTHQPTICIAFVNGAISDADGKPIRKTHSLFQLMEKDSHNVLTRNAEFHFINMKAFLMDLAKADSANMDSFTKWLALITQHDIEDKDIINKIREEDEFMEATAELERMSMDAHVRLSYERRMMQLDSWNRMERELAEEKALRRQLEEESKKYAKERIQFSKERMQSNKERNQAIKQLHKQGISIGLIAGAYNMTEEEINALINSPA